MMSETWILLKLLSKQLDYRLQLNCKEIRKERKGMTENEISKIIFDCALKVHKASGSV